MPLDGMGQLDTSTPVREPVGLTAIPGVPADPYPAQPMCLGCALVLLAVAAVLWGDELGAALAGGAPAGGGA